MGPGLEEQGDGVERAAAVASAAGTMPAPSRGSDDDVGAQQVEQVEQRGERRVLDQHPVAQPDVLGGQPVEGVEGAVDHGDGLGRERQPGPDGGLQLGQHGPVEVRRW